MFLILLILFSLLPNQNPQTTPRQQREAQIAYYDGIKYLQAHEYEKALPALQQAITLYPDFAEAHLALGVIYYVQFKYKSASESFAETIRLRPNGLPPYLLKAEVDIGRGQAGQAEATAAQAIQVNPKSAEAHYWLGYARDTLGKTDEALKSYDLAITLNPKYAAAYNRKGMVASIQGRAAEAIALYKQAIEADGKYGDAHLNLCRIYIKQREFDLARTEVQSLTTIEDPNAKFVSHELQLAEKKDKAERALKVNPKNPQALCDLGMAIMEIDPFIKNDRFERATALFQQALRLSPKHAEAHFGLGLCYVERNETALAQKEYAILKRLNREMAMKLSQRIQEGRSRLPAIKFPNN
ncbi:MAG: tetratricopeptide repeat protein [Acidobacteria bacterium]|nr:tetratricopeptide repeat protein [Acidobacteriota bacterium]